MVKVEWGAKRSCLNCGARFYDMQKPSATCPKCGTVFEVQPIVRGRKGKAIPLDLTKDLFLDDVTADLELGTEINIGEDMMEDTNELAEGLDDMPDVLNANSED